MIWGFATQKVKYSSSGKESWRDTHLMKWKATDPSAVTALFECVNTLRQQHRSRVHNAQKNTSAPLSHAQSATILPRKQVFTWNLDDDEYLLFHAANSSVFKYAKTATSYAGRKGPARHSFSHTLRMLSPSWHKCLHPTETTKYQISQSFLKCFSAHRMSVDSHTIFELKCTKRFHLPRTFTM